MGFMRKHAKWTDFFAVGRWVAVLALVFFACSANEKTALGNSAESGNPEIAGIIRFDDGTLAVHARVALVPAAFSALDGAALDSAFIGYTDSLGRYAFADVPVGAFSLEASDSASGKKFLKIGIEPSADSSGLLVDGTLEKTGSVRLGAHGFADGTTGFVIVPGTTILRPVTVELGNIFVDSLPSDSLYPFVFVSDDGYSLSLEKGVEVVADSVVNVDAEPVSLEFRFPLNTAELGISESLWNFPLALRLNPDDYDFDGIDRIRGGWTAILCGDTIPLDVSYADYSAGNFTFWAKIPKLRAATSDTLRLFFVEGLQTTFADSADRVFSSSYIAAWHFDEGADSVRDATGNGFDGIPESLSLSDSAAVGRALYYGGKSGSVTIPHSSGNDFDVSVKDTISFSVWVKMDDLNQSRVVFGKGATQYHLMFLKGEEASIWLYEAYTDEILGTDSSTLSTRYWYRDSVVKALEWTFISIVQDSSGAKMYVGDSLITATPSLGTSSEARVTDSLFVIGKLIYPRDSATNTVTHYFKGVIDELHVSRIPRSADWIRASYRNQNPESRWPVPVVGK